MANVSPIKISSNKTGRSIEVQDAPCPTTVADAVKAGVSQETIDALFYKAARLEFQAAGRRYLDDPEADEKAALADAAKAIAEHKLGATVRGPKLSTTAKVANMFKGATPEEQKTILAALQASVAKK